MVFCRASKVKRPDVIKGKVGNQTDEFVEKKSDDACADADESTKKRNEAEAKSSGQRGVADPCGVLRSGMQGRVTSFPKHSAVAAFRLFDRNARLPVNGAFGNFFEWLGPQSTCAGAAICVEGAWRQ